MPIKYPSYFSRDSRRDATEVDSTMQSIERHEHANAGARPPHLLDANSIYTYNNNTQQQPASESTSDSGSPINNNSTKPQNKSKSCCARFMRELYPCQSLFRITDSNFRKIDIPASFAPNTCSATSIKAFLWLVGAVFTAYAWIDTQHVDFFMAYLTHWSLMISMLYLCMSLLNTLFYKKVAQPPEYANGWISATWALFATALHAELFITLLFWTMVYGPDTEIGFTTVSLHGVLFIVLYIEGLVVNRIPLRWTHWYYFVQPYMFAYAIWTGIHAYLGIGNPHTDPGEDDAIYAALTWTKEAYKETLVTALVVLFVVSPVLYGLLWLLSLYNLPCCCMYSRRRYIDAHLQKEQRQQDLEEGSIFARWR